MTAFIELPLSLSLFFLHSRSYPGLFVPCALALVTAAVLRLWPWVDSRREMSERLVERERETKSTFSFFVDVSLSFFSDASDAFSLRNAVRLCDGSSASLHLAPV